MALNIPIRVKKIFLSFLQNYYATQDPRLVWNVDQRLTKIFIGDKYIAAPEVIERIPSIIVSRGQMAWAYTSINQMATVDLPMSVPSKQVSTGWMDPDIKRTDLVQCNITLMCLSSNGIEAETIANTVFQNLVGYKDQLKHNGIHQILAVGMGEEQLVRGDAGSRLVSVPINVRFTVQSTIATTLDLYTITVLIDGDFVPYTEAGPYGRVYTQHFTYQVSGQIMYFSAPPPSGSQIAVSYTGRYSLTQYTNITPAGLIDGLNYIYYLPEDVYTTYYILSGIVVIPSIGTGAGYFNYTYS